MKSLEETTFAIIGLGLIGGSYAKALKNRNAHKIIGMDRNHIVSLMAKDEGYITDIADEDPSLLQGADIIICAMYPGAFVSFVKDHVKYFKKDVLLTDVMGIKGSIPDEIDRLLGRNGICIGASIADGRKEDTVKVPPGFSKEQNFIVIKRKENRPENVAWLRAIALQIGCGRVVNYLPGA